MMELFFAYNEPMKAQTPFPSKMRRKHFEHTMRWKADLKPHFVMRDPAVAMELSHYVSKRVQQQTA